MTQRHAAMRIATLAIVAMLGASTARADLLAKYNFNEGAIKNVAPTTIGQWDGNVVDQTGISFFRGGRFDLSNNNNANSNQDFSLSTTRGAYGNLPNSLISTAASNGADDAFSIEIWATVQENRNWARLGEFGGDPIAPGGEDNSGGGATREYLIIVPQMSRNNTFGASTHSATGQEVDVQAPANMPLATGQLHHVVVTVDQQDTTAGINGTMRLYLNGALLNSGAVEPAGSVYFPLVNDVNNWLGRAQFGDPLFDGAYDEVRIHNNALSDSDVAASFATGPDPVPTLIVNRDTGAATIVNNYNSEVVDITSYSLSSAAGTLTPGTRTSIDAGNAFDPTGAWSYSSTTVNLIAESTSPTEGGNLAAAGSRSIGTLWKSYLQDIVFSYELEGGGLFAGDVVYTGEAYDRSDLDLDRDIDAADFATFTTNLHTSLTGLSTHIAYTRGDLNSDGFSNYADFVLFKADYIAANSAAAFATLMAGGTVPEPTTLVSLALGMAIVWGARRRAGR